MRCAFTMHLLATSACLLASPALGARITTEPRTPACDVPPSERPPDPRCGETLDGRPAPQPPGALAAPRLVLWGPRLASRVVFWPVVNASDVVEHHLVLGWLRAVLTTDDGLVGIRPELAYSTSFLPTAGLRLFYRRLPDDAAVTVRFQGAGPSIFLGQVDVRGPAALGLTLSAIWSRRNDRLSAGVGPNSDADLAAQGRGRARYGANDLVTALRWTRRLPGRLVAGLHGDVQRRDYQSDDVRSGPSVASLFGLPPELCGDAALTAPCVDPALMPGFRNGMRMGHLGGSLALDLRGRARDASGVSLALATTYAQGLVGDPSRHVQLAGESVLALGGNDRVLLLRAWGATVERLGAAPVPFEELIGPAGGAGMRGFADGRFRGESGLVGSAEYRWFVAFDLDASLFADVGTVADRSFSNIRWDRWFPSFGAGLRLFQPAGPYWDTLPQTGVQVAYAPAGGFRVLLSLAAF